ncbi:TPA: hypothetical protein HA241_07785 [Candidatus Woesearchaeota archaeon]|nr:hypothetical protein [Candidatus Woesearchaeota archaeon]
MTNLYLVGTVHTDPDGIERLDSLLNELAPKRIFVEISEDRARKIISNPLEDQMKKHEEVIESWSQQGFVLTPEQRAKLLNLIRFKNGSHGFEVRSPSEYKKRNIFTDVYYVDIADEEIVKGVNEALDRSQEPTPEVRQKVLRGLQSPIENHMADLRRLVDFQYKEAHCLASYFDGMSHDPEFFERELAELSPQARESLRRVFDPKRNDHIADGIRKYHINDEISIAVMGAAHLGMVGYLLSDLRPDYILLNEF